MIKLINAKGVPIGISFRKHRQKGNSFVIRITGEGEQTDIGASADSMQECYKRAVEKRLELLGMLDSTDARNTLINAYDAFKQHYGIVIEPVTQYQFKIKGE